VTPQSGGSSSADSGDPYPQRGNPQRPITIAIETKFFIIGEGVDEQGLFSAITRIFEYSSAFQVAAIGGKTRLKSNLSGLVKQPGSDQLEAIAILRDADDDARAAFDSVRNVVAASGLVPPLRHGEFSTSTPRVGIFILPDGARPGMLEDLCIDSVRTKPGFPCVQYFLECVRREGLVPKNRTKAEAHAWLAAQEPTGRRVGEAAGATGGWDLSHPAFEPLISFLRRMAEEHPAAT